VEKVSMDELRAMMNDGGVVPAQKLVVTTLTVACLGEPQVLGIKKEVVVSLSRVEIKSTGDLQCGTLESMDGRDIPVDLRVNNPQGLLFVLHWVKVKISSIFLSLAKVYLQLAMNLVCQEP
jgi:hypothetical protein